MVLFDRVDVSGCGQDSAVALLLNCIRPQLAILANTCRSFNNNMRSATKLEALAQLKPVKSYLIFN